MLLTIFTTTLSKQDDKQAQPTKARSLLRAVVWSCVCVPKITVACGYFMALCPLHGGNDSKI
eukprot:3051056-Amphidinium_carterae.1